jgi:hypothetical protein
MKKYIQKILRGLKAFLSKKFPSFATRVEEVIADTIDVEDVVEQYCYHHEFVTNEQVYDIVDDRMDNAEWDISDHERDLIHLFEAEEFIRSSDIESMIDERVEGLLHEDDFEDSLRNYGYLNKLIKKEVQDYLSQNYEVRFILSEKDSTS